MPRVPDMPCASCGKLMWRGKGVLPEGQATCRECRRRNKPEWQHGTRKGYRDEKCRCDECRAWAVQSVREWRDSRASRGLNRYPYRDPFAFRGECESCGQVFHSRDRKRYCNIQCAGDSKRKQYSTALVHIGPAAPRHAPPTPVTVVTLPKWWSVITNGPCGWCGENFTSVGSGARYCSKRCWQGAASHRNGRRFSVPPQVRLAIYERDEWKCQLCLETTEPDADPLSDWYPSLDHIIPQSKGGAHDVSNLRTAHRWCNAVRGDETYSTFADLIA